MILDGRSPDAIAEAVRVLRAGGLVAFPTETVYGLGADASCDTAVAGIFKAKGRPADHPLIVHVAAGTKGAESLSRFAQPLPPFAQKLVQAFWPGPLTLIVTRQPGVGAAAAGGQDTIGLRCPSHPVAQALLLACAEQGVPGLAGPSANRFGRVSPTTAQHVYDEFGDALPVVDGGACEVGIESTIVDCTRGQPVLLRPGVLDPVDLARACGQRILSKEELSAHTPRASGTLLAHYAPKATLRLMSARELQAGLNVLGDDAVHVAVYARSRLRLPTPRMPFVQMPEAPADAAHELFAQLRAFDERGARLIWVEVPPEDPSWDGVRDRLQRAAAAG